MSAALADATPPRRVVICGGGVVGACTAYFLSTHAASPTVPTLIEKCAPACAASGKVGGFLALVWCDSTPALSRLARASFALHRRPRRRRRLRLPPRPQALRPAAHAPRARPRLAATAAPALGRPLRVRRAAEGARDPRHHRAGPPGPLHQGRPRRVGRRGRHRRGGARRGPGRPRRRRRGEGARRRGGRRRRGARAWPLVRPPRGRQRGVRRVRAQGAQHRAPAARAREDHAALPLPQLPAGARRQDARPRGVPAAHWGGVHMWDEQGREPTR